MDALFILGMVMWAAVVALLVGILLETGKWEDSRELAGKRVQKKPRDTAPRPALAPESCYERCMREFLWNPLKKPVCAHACAL